MKQPAGEKAGLERGAIEQFAEVFSTLAGRGSFKLCALLSPPQPDAHCSLDGTDIFVEVTHFYGTEADTRLILGRTGHAEPSREQRLQSSLIPLSLRVLAALNLVLEKKSGKTYASSPVWLIVRNGFPLWREADFQRHRDQIVVPQVHPFSEIWLVCGPRSDFGILRLDNAA